MLGSRKWSMTVSKRKAANALSVQVRPNGCASLLLRNAKNAGSRINSSRILACERPKTKLIKPIPGIGTDAMGRTNKREKNSAGGLDSRRLAKMSSGIAINAYIQKLVARKAASVRANHRFRLRTKFPSSAIAHAERLMKIKNAAASAIMTINTRRFSGISGFFRIELLHPEPHPVL